MAYADHIALGCFDDHRLFPDGPDTQYGDLWLIDDGSACEAVEGAEVGHCKGASLDLVRQQAALPGPVGQVVHVFYYPQQVFLIRIADHGHDQVAVGQGSCHPDIDLFSVDDIHSVYRSVHAREFLQHMCSGLYENGRVGELFLFTVEESIFVLFTPVDDGRHIDVDE